MSFTGYRTLLSQDRGFTLVEVLATLVILAFLVFLAIPHLLRIWNENEQQQAITRAQEINLAIVQFMQDEGMSGAITQWSGAANEADRFTNFVISNLRYGLTEDADGNVIPNATNATEYMPDGYTATLPTSLQPLTKVTVAGPDGTAIDYH